MLRACGGSKHSRFSRCPDLIAELTTDADFALVRAECVAGVAWIHSHPCPVAVEDTCMHPLFVEACELEDAERAGLVLWRIYSCRR